MPAASEIERPRMPAEWEPQGRLWTAWPADEALWGRDIARAREEFLAFAEHVRSGATRLDILVPPEGLADGHPLRELAGADVGLHGIAYGDVWVRDTGPTFLEEAGSLASLRFTFNGWGGSYLFDADLEVGAFIEERAGVAAARRHRCDLVCEGGAVESDGAGTVITTRACLLNPNRNPGRDEAWVEAQLSRWLGAERVVWLDEGLLADHTDGHVDTIARFLAPGRVACHVPMDGRDPNADVQKAIARSLAEARDAAGRRFEVVEVPSPGTVTNEEGDLMPASYLNFVMTNGLVVVPVYGAAQDGAAVEALAAALPGFRVVASSARGILSGGGAFHCTTQQQPALSGSAPNGSETVD